MSNPRVLILNDTDAFAGTEQYIFSLARELLRAGENVAVACPASSPLAKRLHEIGHEVLSILPVASDISALKKVVRQLKSEEVTVLHANNGRTALFATLAITIARRGRCVSTQHFLQPAHVKRTGIKAGIWKIAHRWVDRRVHRLIAISQATRKGSLARGEAEIGKITVVPNGVSSPDRTGLRTVDSVRGEFGLSTHAPLIVCVARLEPEKDVTTLINAIATIRPEVPEVVCLIAGEGTEREKLSTHIAGLGLDRSVRLLGFRSDVNSIVNACDLFVLPSRAEPFGLSLVEAMSLGKPVIATKAGGPLEIVDDGRTGMLVEPGSAQEMAKAIGRLLTAPQLRQEMGRRGEERYWAEFTVRRMADQTLDVYRQALPAAPTPRAPFEAASKKANHPQSEDTQLNRTRIS